MSQYIESAPAKFQATHTVAAAVPSAATAGMASMAPTASIAGFYTGAPTMNIQATTFQGAYILTGNSLHLICRLMPRWHHQLYYLNVSVSSYSMWKL